MSRLHRSIGLALAMTVLAAAHSIASAAIVVKYEYVDHPTNFHPTTQGWSGPSSSTNIDGLGGVVDGTNNSGASALQLFDTDVVTGPIVTAAIAPADYSGDWTLTARLRVDSANSIASYVLSVATGNYLWNIWFSPNDSTLYSYDSNGPSGAGIYTAMTGLDITNYHTYKLVGNGANAPELWVDGVQTGVFAGGLTSTSEVVQWGAIWSGGTTGTSNWQLVRFDTGLFGVPEPASLGVLSLGGLLLVRKRR